MSPEVTCPEVSPGLGMGAGDRSRTRDILITSEALYQLSYTGTPGGRTTRTGSW